MIKKIAFILLLFLLNFALPSNIRAEESINDLLHQMKTESEEISSFLREEIKRLEKTLNREKAEYEEKKYAMGYLQVLEDVTINAELGSALENHIGHTRANFGKMKYASMEYIKKVEGDIGSAEFAIRYVSKYEIFAIIMEYLVDTDFFKDRESLKRSLKKDLAPLKELGNEVRKIKKSRQ